MRAADRTSSGVKEDRLREIDDSVLKAKKRTSIAGNEDGAIAL